MKIKQIFNLLLRYFILLLLSLHSLFLIYYILTPLTVYPVYFILKLVYGADLVFLKPNVIAGTYLIKLIPACIAGAAYYFLMILDLTTPMNLKTRIKSISFLLGSFFILNILRIIIFSAIAFSGLGFQYFDMAHKVTWYFGSTLLVIVIWFSNVRLFNIKNIPIITDIKNIYKAVKTRN